MQNIAPIILFTYRRLDTLKKCVAALQKNILANDTDLHIFSDAASDNDDASAVEKVRDFIKTIQGFKSIHIYLSEKNKGLATSIINGVTKIIKQYDKVIVVEDDLITTPNFLLFMNSSLERYYQNSDVFSVSGYSFNLGNHKNWKADGYFLNRGWSWGWATWKNRWDKIDWQIKDYKEFTANKKYKKEFAKGGSDLNNMLKKQMTGKLDSWAIRWFYNQYKLKGLTYYPLLSKVFNNGFDNMATHTKGSSNRYLPQLDTLQKNHFVYPEKIEINALFQNRFSKKMGVLSRVRSKVQDFFKNLFK